MKKEDREVQLKKWLPFVRQVARRYPEKDRDDLVQEGLIAVEQALQTYDAAKGSGIFGWIGWRVTTAISRSARSMSNGGTVRNQGPNHVSLDAPIEGFGTDMEPIDLHDLIADDNATEPRDVLGLAQLPAALWMLTNREREVIRARYVDGLNLAEAGELLGCSWQNVDQHERRALKKMRAFLERKRKVNVPS